MFVDLYVEVNLEVQRVALKATLTVFRLMALKKCCFMDVI